MGFGNICPASWCPHLDGADKEEACKCFESCWPGVTLVSTLSCWAKHLEPLWVFYSPLWAHVVVSPASAKVHINLMNTAHAQLQMVDDLLKPVMPLTGERAIWHLQQRRRWYSFYAPDSCPYTASFWYPQPLRPVPSQPHLRFIRLGGARPRNASLRLSFSEQLAYRDQSLQIGFFFFYWQTIKWTVKNQLAVWPTCKWNRPGSPPVGPMPSGWVEIASSQCGQSPVIKSHSNSPQRHWESLVCTLLWDWSQFVVPLLPWYHSCSWFTIQKPDTL